MKQAEYQISLFDGDHKLTIDKPIRLIELFAGYGSQALALKYLGANFEHWKICEWAVKSIQAYKDLHFGDDNTDYSATKTQDEVINYLYSKGISANYNEPMTIEQIKRLGEQKQRVIYNNLIATHNLVSVCNCHASDLEISDTDKYTYIMTYSFPCQDLSLAGKGLGMEKGSGTRSGLLWEVERILDECNGNLPQILLMENVPEVIGTNNSEHFSQWVAKLDSLGYKSKWEILNAKDYGVPQNRARCFMVSWLGNYYYDFPKRVKLEKFVENITEKQVNKKYYLSDKMLSKIKEWKSKQQPLERVVGRKSTFPTITARGGGEMHSGMIIINEELEDTTNCVEYIGMVQISKSDNFIQGKDRITYKKEYLDTIVTRPKEAIIENGGGQEMFRIITEKECFRGMGVRDEDFDKIAKNQASSSLYHLAGDSIVVDVLMEIFGQML